MKRLCFTYELTLDFSEPVSRHTFLFRFHPNSDRRQQLWGLETTCQPCAGLPLSVDAFGNLCACGHIEAPHERLSLRVRGDALVQDVLVQYGEHSIFARTDWEKDAEGIPVTPDAAVQMIQGQLRYIIHDPYISRARKMLVIEQFQNPELAKLQTKQNYTDVMQYFTGMMKRLAEGGILTEYDPQIMAAQFCLPISVWINVCDREPEREKEVMELVEKHIRQFFRLYQKA